MSRNGKKWVVFAVATPIVLYAVFIFGKISYFANFSGIPEIVQEDIVFGEGEELRYIAAGDSAALGVGASNVESTFTYKIADELGANYKVVYKNIAEEGAKTSDVIKEQLQEIILFNPDIVVISIGGNDITHVRLEESIIENYVKIIEEIKNKTNATLFITNIPNFDNADLLPEWHREIIEIKSSNINPDILALEGGRIIIIDIYGEWYGIPNAKDTYASDQFHPNDYGYELWKEVFLEQIQKSLSLN